MSSFREMVIANIDRKMVEFNKRVEQEVSEVNKWRVTCDTMTDEEFDEMAKEIPEAMFNVASEFFKAVEVKQRSQEKLAPIAKPTTKEVPNEA